MGRLDWRMLFCAFLIASNFQDAAQLILKEQRVPLSILAGKEPYVILDCDYDLQKTSTEALVVKWWHNENDPIYQWIYPNPPQSTGIVDKYIDLEYKASDDPKTMYRAMKFNNPGIDLTGDYTCTVSTIDEEVTHTSYMLVWATGKLKLNPKKTLVNGAEGVELTCHAEGVYPRPTLDVSVDNTIVAQSPVVTNDEETQRYNITTRVELKDSDVPDPLSLQCILGIPAANYTYVETRTYHPGPPTTTTTTTSTTMQRKMDNQVLHNSQPDTDNGGGNTASSISNVLIIMLVSIAAGSATLF